MLLLVNENASTYDSTMKKMQSYLVYMFDLICVN
jgi:hypothetical protein